jgi:RecB family endonuclease NucS
VRLIFARCRVIYTGRIDAELEIGDRLVIRKDDGAVIVHSTSGLKERNWMPAGSTWNEEPGVIVCEYAKRGERLDIYLDEVYSDREHHSYLDGRLVKLGSEREFSDLIRDNLDLISPGLTCIKREAMTPAGPIDLLCHEPDGSLVAIEVKRNRGVGMEVAYQIQRYLDALKKMPDWGELAARGMLVAPGLTKGVKELLAEREVEYVRLSFEDLEAQAQERAERDPRPLREIAHERRLAIIAAVERRGLSNPRLLDPTVRRSGVTRELDLVVDAGNDDMATLMALAGLAVEVSALLGRRPVDVTTLEMLEDEERIRVAAATWPL